MAKVPPLNVRVVIEGNAEVPVDVVFDRVEGGNAIWRVVNAPADIVITGLRVEMLPAETAIEVPMH